MASSALACVVTILSSAASAQSVYSQPPAASGTSGISDANSFQQELDDFILSDDATVDSVRWWGSYGANPDPASLDSFTLRFFLDSGSGPSPLPLIVSGPVTGVTRVMTGLVSGPLPPHDGGIVYVYTAQLHSPVLLVGGTQYYLSIVNQTGSRWGWYDSGPGMHWLRSFPGSPWAKVSTTDFGFELLDLPEIVNSPSVPFFEDSLQRLGGNAFSEDVALGDIDGDGDLDAVVANRNNEANVFYENVDGVGTFAVGSTFGSSASYALALGDLDGDNDLDVFVANNGGQANRVWINSDGAGTFVAGQSMGSRWSSAVVLADIDNDGDLDAIVGNCCSGDLSTQVFFNNGAGTFSDSGQALGGYWTYGFGVADFDGNGFVDIFEGNSTPGNPANRVYLNTGAGVFVDSGAALGNGQTAEVAIADIDGDGELDALETNWSGSLRIWIGDGLGGFTTGQQISVGNSPGSDLADIDGDGDLDVYVTNNGSPDRVLLNDGSGFFIDSGLSLSSGLTFGWAVALGDLDGDGDPDAFAAHSHQVDHVWMNRTGVRYCVSGFSNGATYAWEVLGGATHTELNASTPAAGSPASVLVASFAANIDAAALPNLLTNADPSDARCFILDSGGAGPVALRVGPAGIAPSCQVTAAGCVYNPRIFQGFPPAPFPLLSPWARGLLALLLGAGAIALVSHGPRRAQKRRV
jgi:hypothetical protein